MSTWIDVSLPVKHGMIHWPDNPLPEVEQVMDIRKGDICNLTKIAMGAHTGTHMDAMRHFVANGIAMDKMPLEAVIGPARVIEIKDPVAIRRQEIEPYNLQRGERVLFKTTNSELRWVNDEFREDFVYIDPEAARHIVERGVQTVGLDYLSVAPFHDGVTTHKILLGAGVWVIEGLDFRGVPPGNYELICLPMKIVGSDGAPARAVLRKI